MAEEQGNQEEEKLEFTSDIIGTEKRLPQ